VPGPRRHSHVPSSGRIEHNVRRSFTDPVRPQIQSAPPRQSSDQPWRRPTNEPDSPFRSDFFPDRADIHRHDSSASIVTSSPDEEEVDPLTPTIQRTHEITRTMRRSSAGFFPDIIEASTQSASNGSSESTERPSIIRLVVDAPDVQSDSATLPARSSDDTLVPELRSILRQPQREVSPNRKSVSKPHLGLDTSDWTLGQPSIETSESAVRWAPSFGVPENGSPSGSDSEGFSRWWHALFLPPPDSIYGTLFPTLRALPSRSWLQISLAIMLIPAVFLFTVTLPVVDAEPKEATRLLDPVPESGATGSTLPSSRTTPELILTVPEDQEILVAKGWQRWLIGVQCISAPIFMTVIIFGIKTSSC
jgi:hypothetical protein